MQFPNFGAVNRQAMQSHVVYPVDQHEIVRRVVGVVTVAVVDMKAVRDARDKPFHCSLWVRRQPSEMVRL
jgi:hypothetical protein